MDLLQTVRKEGSRGGVHFSWDDVKSSSNRENYLGHSLMAPVGRWQKNKDLNWYARAEDAELTPEERLEKEAERKQEEKRRIKEAEGDAMNRALGLPVPDRTNANNEPLGEGKISQIEVNKALKEALGDDGDEGEERTSGLGAREKKEHRSREHKRRDRSRSRVRRHRHRGDRDDRRRRSRSRDRDGERHMHRRSRSRSRDRKHHDRSTDRRDDREKRSRYHDERPRSRERERRRERARSRSPYADRRRRDDSR